MKFAMTTVLSTSVQLLQNGQGGMSLEFISFSLAIYSKMRMRKDTIEQCVMIDWRITSLKPLMRPQGSSPQKISAEASYSCLKVL